jgi:hypothetical protein
MGRNNNNNNNNNNNKFFIYRGHTNKHTKKQKFETKRSNVANLNIHWLS